jgi:N-acetylglucosaminyl-diphospho-decaprenol L-rhamnosyltransferase
MSILISIVSHKQGDLVWNLLKNIQTLSLQSPFEVVVTVNTEESLPFKDQDFSFKLTLIFNKYPKGFGANHNAAFGTRPSTFFGVLNPDLRLDQDPFTPLLRRLALKGQGVIAPQVLNEDHEIEDSARCLPTPYRLAKRYIGLKKTRKLDYPIDRIYCPDWVAGIFMLFPSPVFAAMKGFDERYFLYFEDVDLCTRLWQAGYEVMVDPAITVMHQARRNSHDNLRYLRWHIYSGCRFFSSKTFWAAWLSGKANRDCLPS